MVAGIDMSNLTGTYIVQTFLNRKFALDTSISSFWTGLSYIEIAHKYPFQERLLNFLNFVTSYLILGTRSGYVQLFDLSRNSYIHYGGGFLTSYFYYWIGWTGVIMISIMIGIFLRKINYLNNQKSDFSKMTAIYIVITMLRWYLYYPIPLFRGYSIFCFIYLFIYIFTKMIDRRNLQNQKIKNV